MRKCRIGQAVKDKEDMYLEFFREVVRRTAQLVAAWQCVGFCHGARAPGLTIADGVSQEILQSGVLSEPAQEFACRGSNFGALMDKSMAHHRPSDPCMLRHFFAQFRYIISCKAYRKHGFGPQACSTPTT